MDAPGAGIETERGSLGARIDTMELDFKKEYTPRDLGRLIGAGVGLLLVLIGLFTSYFTVAPEEEALILRFGAYHGTKPPGLHFKLPFGIDSVLKVPVTEVRKLEFGFRTVQAGRRSVYSQETYEEEALMLTGDLNIADVEWVVQYKIKDAKQWIFSVREQEDTIRDLSESTMRAVIGDYTVTEVLTRERAQIADLARKALQERLDLYGMGVDIVTVQLQNANPPREVQASFNEVNEAQQERSKLENEAEREYNKVIQVARGEAKREISEAEGYQADRINRAKGDVARFRELLRAYQESKEVTRKRLYLETLERVLPKVERIIVADESGILKVLPLQRGAK